MSNQFRLKPQGQWNTKSRAEKLAAVLYPNLTDAQTQATMAALARNEGKKSPTQGRIDAEKARMEQQQTKRSK